MARVGPSRSPRLSPQCQPLGTIQCEPLSNELLTEFPLASPLSDSAPEADSQKTKLARRYRGTHGQDAGEGAEKGGECPRKSFPPPRQLLRVQKSAKRKG